MVGWQLGRVPERLRAVYLGNLVAGVGEALTKNYRKSELHVGPK